MNQHREHIAIAVIILIALGLGAARALITPMWANPEEPHHFLYVRMIAEQRRLPDRITPEARAAIWETVVFSHPQVGLAGPMRNARLQDDLDLNSLDDWQALSAELNNDPSYYQDYTLGVPQLDEPPGYYVYQAVLQWLVPTQSTEGQLLTARMGSVLLAAVTLGAAYLTLRDLFPDHPMIRVGVPGLLAVHPNFMTEMAAVNNTAAAVAAMAVVLWASVRLIMRGPSVGRLIVLGIAFVLCGLSKPTAWGGLLIALMAVPLALRIEWPRWIWAALGGTALIGVIAVFSVQGPFGWYPQEAIYRTEVSSGKHALLLRPNTDLWQPLTPSDLDALRGQSVTISAEMRSRAGAVEAPLPALWVSSLQGEFAPLDPATTTISEEWQTVSTTVTMPDDVACASVRVVGVDETAVLVDDVQIDGDILTNSSVERRWLMIRPQITALLPDQLADTGLTVNRRLSTFVNLPDNLFLVSLSVRWLYTTFWSRVMWGAPGLPLGVLGAVSLLTVVSAAGLLRFMGRTALDRWQHTSLTLIGAAVLLVGVLCLLRIDPPRLQTACDAYQGRFIGLSYYTSPAFFPAMTLWFLGLWAWVPQAWKRWYTGGIILLFFMLSVVLLLNRHIPYMLLFYGLEMQPNIWSVPANWGP